MAAGESSGMSRATTCAPAQDAALAASVRAPVTRRVDDHHDAELGQVAERQADVGGIERRRRRRVVGGPSGARSAAGSPSIVWRQDDRAIGRVAQDRDVPDGCACEGEQEMSPGG